jgi:hypothetical protein
MDYSNSSNSCLGSTAQLTNFVASSDDNQIEPASRAGTGQVAAVSGEEVVRTRSRLRNLECGPRETPAARPVFPSSFEHSRPGLHTAETASFNVDAIGERSDAVSRRLRSACEQT